MAKRRGSQEAPERAQHVEAGDPPGLGPELPVQKAFVLQLTRDTGPALQPFAGRVEHLSTGRRARFEKVDELLDALARLLKETGS